MTKDEVQEKLNEAINMEVVKAHDKKEVDFHHKVAYKFERGYRISKQQPEKKLALNMEIIQCISEHSDFINDDQMTLFFCLYFCIYFNNPDLVEFLRSLIHKMNIHDKRILRILELIDVNGILRLRKVGEAINQQLYHMVLYEAFDANLRVIYLQIFRQLKFI
jgi:hypothetical protein